MALKLPKTNWPICVIFKFGSAKVNKILFFRSIYFAEWRLAVKLNPEMEKRLLSIHKIAFWMLQRVAISAQCIRNTGHYISTCRVGLV